MQGEQQGFFSADTEPAASCFQALRASHGTVEFMRGRLNKQRVVELEAKNKNDRQTPAASKSREWRKQKKNENDEKNEQAMCVCVALHCCSLG